MAKKRAAGVLVTLGDNWRIQYDGERCFEIEQRVEVDRSHHLAKKEGGESHRWLSRGYYGHLPEVLRALSQKMTAAELVAMESPTLLDILVCIDESTKMILEAAKEIAKKEAA